MKGRRRRRRASTPNASRRTWKSASRTRVPPRWATVAATNASLWSRMKAGSASSRARAAGSHAIPRSCSRRPRTAGGVGGGSSLKRATARQAPRCQGTSGSTKATVGDGGDDGGLPSRAAAQRSRGHEGQGQDHEQRVLDAKEARHALQGGPGGQPARRWNVLDPGKQPEARRDQGEVRGLAVERCGQHQEARRAAITTPAIAPTVAPKARAIAAAPRAAAAAPSAHQTAFRRPKPPLPLHSAATRYAVPGGWMGRPSSNGTPSRSDARVLEPQQRVALEGGGVRPLRIGGRSPVQEPDRERGEEDGPRPREGPGRRRGRQVLTPPAAHAALGAQPVALTIPLRARAGRRRGTARRGAPGRRTRRGPRATTPRAPIPPCPSARA